jgi:hypothetical protein
MGLQAASTNISIGNAIVQPSVKRLGMNLGQMAPYGSQQIYKNLFASNPGFNNTQYQSVLYCSAGSTANLCVSGSISYYPIGFWPTDGSVSVRVLTGKSAGCMTTLSSWSNANYGFASACGISAGDYIAVKKVTTPGAAGFNPTEGWSTKVSGSTEFSVSPDVPPAVNGTAYTQSLKITAPSANDTGMLLGYADNDYLPWTGDTKSFIDLDGSYTVSYWAKAVSGASPQVTVGLKRGNTFYVNNTDNLTSTWTQYSHTFTASETGQQMQLLTLSFAVSGAETILLDKVSVTEAATSGNPTVFRDAVVATLKALKPGVLRMSDGEGTTNTLSNMMVDQWARMPVNFATVPLNGAPGYYNPIGYSIPEFLQLCQTVGAEPWISLPITMTPAEAVELIDYLSGPASTAGGALRISQGFSTPWTAVFSKIHLELGNEEWNGGVGFEGGSMEYNYGTYGAYAQSLFAAMKASASYNSPVTSLVLGAQFVNSYLLQIVQNSCNNNDEIDIAPYTANTLTDATSLANIWQPGLAEPQVFWQAGAASGTSMVCAEYTSGVLCPSQGYFNVGGAGQPVYGGAMYLDALAEANSTHPAAISIYEENNSANQGTFSQSQLNQYASAWGAGLEQASEFLMNMQHGILTQNLYQLTGYYVTPIPNPNSAGATYIYLFGSVVDMGGATDLRRPQFLAEQVINSGITPGAAMLATTQTGTPTFSVGNPAAYPATGSTVNTVATTAANTIQSFAFNNGGGSYSLILLNLDVASSHAVTFSGANAPAGLVTVTTLTSTNLGDSNEASAVVVPATSTLSSPAGMTLAPYAMYLLTWNAQSQPPIISDVAVANTTSTSATITWTTDQAATSIVNYGPSSSYGYSSVNSAMVTSHSVVVTGLTPGTAYNFDVGSANSANVTAVSSNASFMTQAASTATPPYVGYLAYWGITDSGVTVSWSTDLAATTVLAYGTTPSLGQFSPMQSALTNNHGVVLTGLMSGTTYYFVAESTGANGATGYSTTYSFKTAGVAQTVPLVISNVAQNSVSATAAIITWTTSQPATSQVNYGVTSGYGLSSPLDSSLVTSHSVTLSGLAPGTTYYFDVVSVNSGGTLAASPAASFATMAVSSPPPSVGYVSAWGVTSSGATITWSSSVPATTLLAYGTTPSLGQMSLLQAALTSSHGVVLTGLTSGTTYYFVAQSTDSNGVTGYSTVYSFTTY